LKQTSLVLPFLCASDPFHSQSVSVEKGPYLAITNLFSCGR
jgi:hypothetical protein